MNMDHMFFLNGLKLADENFFKPEEIDDIIGADVFADILDTEKLYSEDKQCVAISSQLGFVVMGNVSVLENGEETQHSFCTFDEAPLQRIIKGLWEVEDIPNSPSLTEAEEACEAHYLKTVTRDKTGRFTVDLPLKEVPSLLGSSHATASKCLFLLENKLKSNEDFKTTYNSVLQNFLDGQFMDAVDEVLLEDGHYIPHHAIIKKDSSSTPLRVVLDAEAKTTSGKSFNDVLDAGPKLHTDIVAVLLNFRRFPIILTADIKQMYLLIKVRKEHPCYQRILWRFSEQQSIRTYELNTVTCGLTSSPFLAYNISPSSPTIQDKYK